jgi:hypothetical protein
MQAGIARTLGAGPDQDLRDLLEKVIGVGPFTVKQDAELVCGGLSG